MPKAKKKAKHRDDRISAVLRVLARMVAIKDSVLYYLRGLYNRTGEDHVFLLGAGIAFLFFICCVPLVLIVFSVLGYVLENETVTRNINAFIDTMIPYQAPADAVRSILFERLSEVKNLRNIAGYAGAIGLLFAASGLFSGLRTALTTIFRIETGESLIRDKLRDFQMVLLVLFFFLLATTIMPLLKLLSSLAIEYTPLQIFDFGRYGEASVATFLSLTAFLLFLAVYYFITNRKISVRVAAMSAFWATLLWKMAEVLFGYYITERAVLDRIYGAYVFMVVVAFWVYYSSIVLLVAAEIGQLYRERREERQEARATRAAGTGAKKRALSGAREGK